MTDNGTPSAWQLYTEATRKQKIAEAVTSQRAARLMILLGMLLTLITANYLDGWVIALPLVAAACLTWAYWMSWYHRSDSSTRGV